MGEVGGGGGLTPPNDTRRSMPCGDGAPGSGLSAALNSGPGWVLSVGKHALASTLLREHIPLNSAQDPHGADKHCMGEWQNPLVEAVSLVPRAVREGAADVPSSPWRVGFHPWSAPLGHSLPWHPAVSVLWTQGQLGLWELELLLHLLRPGTWCPFSTAPLGALAGLPNPLCPALSQTPLPPPAGGQHPCSHVHLRALSYTCGATPSTEPPTCPGSLVQSSLALQMPL